MQTQGLAQHSQLMLSVAIVAAAGQYSMSPSVAALAIISLMASGSAVAETHRFEPSQYHNTFSFAHEPVLSIKPGDRVVTKTIDARGFDADNEQVGERPNPQTGPFFVEGAEPGDVLVVRFEKLEPSRPTAWSSSVLAPYTADPAFLRHEAEREQTTETWNIDNDRGVATVA